ncbi:hypothetical protein [Candidatus Odyssella acanthamoebae]|uniref:Uncharacterized protein n=1 Tax=Candidatus Odyssella acanthamoebae TaxID=91604 RepID=A0A077AW95_9PROT|nr:hypothetical protein [Candidatus Paracaedibacter acanthamoebae]AIK96681.1 hypothetical protein ID47_08040 [Candidatus Paracaedibacter acanthamoebae]
MIFKEIIFLVFIDFFGKERLQLPLSIMIAILKEIEARLDHWHQMIDISFLPPRYKSDYQNLRTRRSHVIF